MKLTTFYLKKYSKKWNNYGSSIPKYFDPFRFNTLRVFNILYASLLTFLYEPLTFFNILLRKINLYAPLILFTNLYCSSTTFNFSFAQLVFT